MISFPEGTMPLVTDDKRRLLQKWNQIWYDLYGNVPTSVPEGTEPLTSDSAQRSYYKLRMALGGSGGEEEEDCLGDNLLVGSYSSEGALLIPVVIGETYRWEKGAGEYTLYNFGPGCAQFFHLAVDFVACGENVTVYSTNLNGAATGSVRQNNSCEGSLCYSGTLLETAIYGEGGGGDTFPLTLVNGATYRWVKGPNDYELHHGVEVLTASGLFVASSTSGELVGLADSPVSGDLYQQVPCT